MRFRSRELLGKYPRDWDQMDCGEEPGANVDDGFLMEVVSEVQG